MRAATAARGLRSALPARPPPAQTIGLPPAHVPVASLSLRSVMDVCTRSTSGTRTARPSAAASLDDLPCIAGRDLAAIEATLHERGVPVARFVQWYNAYTRPTWPECAALLEPLQPGELPPFVLQRALHKVSHSSEAASAMRVVARHLPTLGVDEAHRLCLFLWHRLARTHEAWHTVRLLTHHTLETVRRWLDKREPQPGYAHTLLVTAFTIALRGCPDERARAALLRVWAMACERAPPTRDELVAHLAHRVHTRRGAAWLSVPMLHDMLAPLPPEAQPALLRVAVRVAAAQGDTAQARQWYAALDTTADEAATPLLRALAHSPSQADIHEAWSLFDALVQGTPPLPQRARLADWVLMLRAAAGDARIPAARVAALLGLPGRDGRMVPGQGAPWRVPEDMCAQLQASVVAHTALVDGLLARGDEAYAWAVWDAMLQRGIAPDVWALTTLCRLYFQAGHPARALECIVHFCHQGWALPPRGTAVELRVPAVEALSDVPLTQARHDASARRVCVPPSTYLANTLLAGLWRAGAHETVLRVWEALGPTLHVRPDAASLQIMLGAAASAAGRANVVAPLAVREYVRRTLLAQYPELQKCADPLEAAGRSVRGWLVRGELRLRRWEQWMEQRVAGLLRGAAGRADTPPAPAAAATLCIDAQGFYQYCRLLQGLLDADGALPSAALAREITDELFLVPAWMRALDLVPTRATLCLLCAAQDERLPPAAGAAPLREWLVAWLGKAHVPSDEEIGAWFREHRRPS
ncbi:hypothetical protein MCAP1_002133 [Malassezia caprae]|uniref:Pentatricopeptide repeat-containing protein n=1 Tax=Malassezia caprae TaxID=1381934 RepID=A0AAF0EC21_9BASI|nr:hypothetical protein MCAP1_002133 [Malassezia caprae]